MFILKHLKTLQHVSIIIQIIFRELVCSLLKSLILKFVKNVKFNVVMRQHNIWCVYVCFYLERYAGLLERYTGLQSGIPLQIQHTYTHHVLCCRITTPTFYILNKF